MLGAVAKHIFGSVNDRIIRKFKKHVEQINALEADFEKLSDDELRAKTSEYRKRLDDGETLDMILPEAFATVREAAKRSLGQRHYDVQLIGGMVLHKGMIAEMKTGEGKTLVATLAVYLNALSGKGVHVVTVNDYLASRDAEWMGQVYRFLGLSVGCITNGMDDMERKQAYNSDVTYATNNELGFDYLRDNMKFRLDEMVQRPFNFAIVDEVDSILVDEARTPLIISGQAEDSSEKYIQINNVIPELKESHYEIDEKARQVTLTESGITKVEETLKEREIIKSASLFDVGNVSIVHHVDQALKAHKLFKRDVDYIVKDNKVIIIDEFTGRMMDGRRYSDGLHQAIEAKEHVKVQSENQTLASVTFQNYFRMYPKLSGMTGTAMTEATEFADIYALDVVEIPTNVPVKRADHHDEIYRTAQEKYDAIIKTIEECAARKQPVLVGTTSIEKSELVADLLRKRTKIKFEVLNARHHEREAYIVAQAGMPGAVTIATNMAGRGTDIKLGGNLEMRIAEETSSITDEAEKKKAIANIEKEIQEGKKTVLEAGGLYIIGTERHESRRIDNQLRGRSGRQGDPGASKFFLSLEDDLMRIFGSERMDFMLRKMGMPDGEAIIHPWINKALEKAQEKVEGRNYDIRKNLLKYDDVMNDQRKVIYEQRKEIMNAEDVSGTIEDMRIETFEDIIANCVPERSFHDDWDIVGLKQELQRMTGFEIDIVGLSKEDNLDADSFMDKVIDALESKIQEKRSKVAPEIMLMVEKSMLLQILDQAWKEHIGALDHMRHTILLRAYGQKDPLNEYKKEAFAMFANMLRQIREKITNIICRVEIVGDIDEIPEQKGPKNITAIHEDPSKAGCAGCGGSCGSCGDDDTDKAEPFRHASASEFDKEDPNTWGKVARNDLCPCGSGKKYKHCHGKIA